MLKKAICKKTLFNTLTFPLRKAPIELALGFSLATSSVCISAFMLIGAVSPAEASPLGSCKGGNHLNTVCVDDDPYGANPYDGQDDTAAING